jgi:hypothetical protein
VPNQPIADAMQGLEILLSHRLRTDETHRSAAPASAIASRRGNCSCSSSRTAARTAVASAAPRGHALRAAAACGAIPDTRPSRPRRRGDFRLARRAATGSRAASARHALPGRARRRGTRSSQGRCQASSLPRLCPLLVERPTAALPQAGVDHPISDGLLSQGAG